MSNNLFKIFGNLLKSFNSKTIKLTSDEITTKLLSVLLVTGIHGTYAISTSDKEEISIVKKYKIVNYGSTSFMIVDDKGRHFNVNNSLWYWKWDSIEDWYKIKESDKLQVKYYGVRLPIFGLFPNIVRSSTISDKKCTKCNN